MNEVSNAQKKSNSIEVRKLRRVSSESKGKNKS